MGFSGGGSNITKPHTHDSTIVQDGGSLAPNVTQFGLTAGSILYSDGSNIQELAVGSASDALVVNGGATAPEWAAAGGSIWTQLAHTTSLTTVGSYNVLKATFSATIGDYSEIVGIGNVTPGVNSYGWRVNDLAGTAYDYAVATVGFATGADHQGQTSQDSWKFGRYLVGVSAAQLEIHIQRNDNYGDFLTATGSCAGNAGMCSAGGILNADVDTMTSLSICSEAENLPAGELTVYSVTKT